MNEEVLAQIATALESINDTLQEILEEMRYAGE